MTLKDFAKLDVKELKNIRKPKDKPVKLPTKTTINLAMREEAAIPAKRLAIYIAAAVVALLLLVKFGIIDQNARVNAMQAQYDLAHQQLTAQQEELTHYPEVESEYLQYSKSWMQDESSENYVGVDRAMVLDLIESRMMSVGNVDSATIQGNMLVVNMSGMNLEQISAMFSVLEKEPIVADLALTIASTEEDTASVLNFSVTVQLQQPEEGAQG